MKNLFKVFVTVILCSFMFTSKASAAGIDMNSAQTVAYGETLNEKLLFKDQENWYRFTASDKDAWSKIRIVGKSTEIVQLYLYDQDGIQIDNMYASENKENSLWLKLQASGVYYIKIDGGYANSIGEFILSIEEINDDVPDSSDHAKSISINSPVKGKLQCGGDQDWFKIKSDASNSWYKFNLINKNLTKGALFTLYDSNNVELYNFKCYDQGDSKSLDLKLGKNKTYYIKISEIPYYATSVGEYQISVKKIKDDAGESQDTAAAVSLKKTYTKQINVSGDIDYFKFKATSTANYNITVKNATINGSMTIAIYDKDGARIDSTNLYGTGSTIKRTKKLYKNKTYYVGITSRNVGKYTINVSPKAGKN